MFFPRIGEKNEYRKNQVLTLQHNVLSKNSMCSTGFIRPVLTLQHNVLSKNRLDERPRGILVLTLQHNVLSKNIVDIAI